MRNLTRNLSRLRQWAKKERPDTASHQRTEITIETKQILIIRRRQLLRGWCSECGGEVEMAVMEEGAEFSGLGEKAASDLSQAQGWHVLQTEDGRRLICLNSMNLR
jgi:hypothetical protein